MSSNQTIECQGLVVNCLKDGIFLVKIVIPSTNKEHIIKAKLSGKIRKNTIKIINGDNVTLAISKIDVNQARITRRNTKRNIWKIYKMKGVF